jgi:signal transduction histidine kinase
MNKFNLNSVNTLRNKKSNSIMYQYTFWYVINLLLVVLLMGITLIVAVSLFLFQDLKHDLTNVQADLKRITDKPSNQWEKQINYLLYPEFTKFNVEMKNTKTGEIAHSQGWEKIISSDNNKFHYLNIKNFLIIKDEGLFYKHQISFGQNKQIIIYAKLSVITDFIKLMINILVVTTLLALIFGISFILFITKRNIRPLLSITTAVNEIKSISNLSGGVPVPEKPQELTDLGTSINRLLFQLHLQIEREKGFVSDASHELRTPLAALRGHINLIKRRGKAHPEILEQSLTAIDQESERMQNLIHQLLAMARSEHYELELVDVNMSELVSDVLRTYWKEDRNITLELNIDKDLHLNGDVGQLSQILIILVENAQKYTESGGKVIVELTKNNREVHLTVKDTGIGIPKEHLDKIFHRFYRVHKDRSRQTGGSGLGLSIAKQLVAFNGGDISVKSEVGKGSEFKVIFKK